MAKRPKLSGLSLPKVAKGLRFVTQTLNLKSFTYKEKLKFITKVYWQSQSLDPSTHFNRSCRSSPTSVGPAYTQ